MSAKYAQKQSSKRDHESKKLKKERYSDDEDDDDDDEANFDQGSEQEEDPEVMSRARGKKGKKVVQGRKRLHKESKKQAAMMYIDDKASEDSDDEDGGVGKREDAYYNPDQLKRKNAPLNLDEVADKYAIEGQDDEEEDDDGDDDVELPAGYADDDIVNRSLLPSPNKDPKLWQVRVKKNFEKMAVMALLNKSIDFAQRGQPLSILSVTSSDSTEGFIFVEAFKEIHVKEACANLHYVFNSYILLPTNQMPSVYQNDKAKNNEIRTHQWIRIKQGGAYNQDIGLVEKVYDSKVWIRLIPRIEPSVAQERLKGKAMFRRVSQKFNLKPQSFPNCDRHTSPHSVLKKIMYSIRNQLIYKGFVYKSFAFKQIDSSESVKPTHEELINFQNTLINGKSKEDEDEGDNEDERVERVIKKTLMQGGQTVYMKGDKISVNKGDCTGMRGSVIEIEGGMLTFKPIDIPLDLLQIDIAHVSKYFEPGDLVRITEGIYRGDTGQVMDVDGHKVSMVLDQNQNEINIHANHLKLKSDTDQLGGQNQLGGAGTSRHGYKAGDLVLYNGSKNSGLVLQVHEDYLKMINEQSKIVNIKIVDLGKKVPLPPRNGTLNGRDKSGNTLAVDQVVKIVEGSERGKNGTIRHGHRHYLFLWNKEFPQSNGIFVVNSRQTEILGGEFLERGQAQGMAVANQNRLLRDKLVGKMVFVTKGKYKGHRGRVTYADDRQAKVELSSQCRIIPIDKQFIKLVEEPSDGSQANGDGRSVYGGQSMHGGATVYDSGKTPMAKHTPSYYPQSQWGGGIDNFDNANDGAKDFMNVPGSEHFPNQDYNYGASNNNGDAGASFKREREV